ncbi:hypothetical protein A374_03819 [Fictibacillus macauensis ZFHKF-1]|uniref:Uncharacterized protein n=1 Tax=Fictibacillus macauensis ZFHKF-1 TaxID=1196324 RepID=I8UIL2_9BACL|nr:hypothetical protein [Fictibacillus macauensis]EIT86668.1 hypothetical protein A374_03819 [Fictibacillus macauensis ZFHKF-1]
MTASWQLYVNEKEKIDALLHRGYVICEVTESLEGATVIFSHPTATPIQEVLTVETADARKYFSSLLVHSVTK